ncbi:MAG: ostA-like family protein [Alphaproteobacteria bacterium]|nr:ostA-like family protein [Alphaproteobacteria bacterium]
MKKYIAAALAVFAGTPALAAPAQNSPQPVTISAAKSLQWDRKAKTYTAFENVVATQGNVSLHSDTLTAHYTNARGGAADVTTLDADGNVTISAPPYTAAGDHAVYTVRTGNAVLTGKNLKITSGESVLTAKDRIEYDSRDGTMTAIGNPEAVKGSDTLTADVMRATFTKDATGKMTAQTITARGHVVIKTLSETATGDDGVYDTTTQKAVLTGHVRILQGKNLLQGTRADVDMKTGISRLSGKGDAATEGRVTGTFYPQPKNKAPAENSKAETPQPKAGKVGD